MEDKFRSLPLSSRFSLILLVLSRFGAILMAFIESEIYGVCYNVKVCFLLAEEMARQQGKNHLM